MLSFHSRCLSSGIAHVGVILVDVAVDVIVLLLLPVVDVVVVVFGFVDQIGARVNGFSIER